VSAKIGLSVDRDGVAVLRMRDHADNNALGHAFVDDLRQALEALADEQVKVAVVAGLDDVFCSGGHRDVLLDLARGRIAPYDLSLTRTLLDVPVPTIAAMAGHAVGGGLVFGLSCDVVVMANESRYGCNFMDLGFTPGMGTTRLLEISVGQHLAAEMMLGGECFRGSHFAGRSHVNHVLPRGQVEERALDLARRFAEKPRLALRMLKRTLSVSRRKAFEEARTYESLMHDVCFAQPRTRQRIEENYVESAGES